MKRLCITLVAFTCISSLIFTMDKNALQAILRTARQRSKQRTQAALQPLKTPTAPPIKPVIAKALPVKKINPTLLSQLQQAIGSGVLTTVQAILRTIPTTEIQNYLHVKDNGGNTILHRAVQLGRVDIITFLLLKGAQTCQINNAGKTPLHIAATKESIEVLLNFGASPFAIDPQGNTPLHLFVEQPQIIQVLLTFGASPAAQNKKGNIPIMLAIERKQLETITILAKSKGSLEIANLQGFTAKTSAIDPAIKQIVDPPPPPKKVKVRTGGAA